MASSGTIETMLLDLDHVTSDKIFCITNRTGIKCGSDSHCGHAIHFYRSWSNINNSFQTDQPIFYCVSRHDVYNYGSTDIFFDWRI